MRLAQILEHLAHQVQVFLVLALGQMGPEPLGQPALARRQKQQRRLMHPGFGECGLAPVLDRAETAEIAVERQAAALGRQQPVEAGLIGRAQRIGALGGILVSQCLIGTPQPIPGAAERDRRKDVTLETGEMRQRPARVLLEPQGEIAREPFQLGEIAAGHGVMRGGDAIGQHRIAVAHGAMRQRVASARPVLGLTQALGTGRTVEQQ